jgi:hypothetical protein
VFNTNNPAVLVKISKRAYPGFSAASIGFGALQ